MRYIFKLTFLAYIIFGMVMKGHPSYNQIAVLLVITALNVYKEKYNNSVYVILVEMAAIFLSVKLDMVFILLFAVPTFDFVYNGYYYLAVLPAAAVLYFQRGIETADSLLLLGVSGMFGLIYRYLVKREDEFKGMYDRERLQRYELESAKNKLLNSAKEAASLAEVKERNRIARQIHDTIGHSIAGNLMQLQAANKLFDRDRDKSKVLIEKSIEELANSLELLRDTVHNIKPKDNLGIEYIKNIIGNFDYCPVEFKHTGDFNDIPANILEILSTNIKEALTNITKYSKASKANISVESNEKYIRLYIRDNGVGCSRIKENMGLGGMKERILNIGGSISISGDDGFLIVCIIPINESHDTI